MKNFTKSLLLIVVVVFCCSKFTQADVAPDPGEMRVSADLIIETTQDLSDYRFFLDFFGAVHEVEIKSNSQTVIPPQGGGARYSSGTLFAVSKKSLKDFPAKPNGNDLSTLLHSVEKGILEGNKLGKHQFSSTIKISQRKNWTYPIYRLEREGSDLKLVKTADLSPKISLEEESKMRGGGIDFALYGVYKELTPFGYFTFIGFPVLAIIIAGIWFFRRKSQQTGEKL